MRPIVVVGASLAGLRAAQAIRTQGWEGRLLLVGDEPHRPYTRPPLSKELLDGRHEPHTGDFPCQELDVEWRLGQPATALEVANRTVTIGDERVEYETLIVATGTRARRWPGETGPNVFTLRDRDDAIALKAALNEAQQRRDRRRRLHRLRGRLERPQAGPATSPSTTSRRIRSRRSARSSASAAPQLHRDHGVDAQARRPRRPRAHSTPT